MRKHSVPLGDIDDRERPTEELEALEVVAEASGEESGAGSNPAPDEDVVEQIGEEVGVTYADDEELRLGGKEAERDEHRWELDPASAEDYPHRAPEGPANAVRHMKKGVRP